MCGIWAWFGPSVCPDAAANVNTLLNRGPESCKLVDVSGGTFGFTRLAINGLHEGGMQPFDSDGIMWICNGEIYNARALATEYNIPMPSGSDCEVLGPLYKIHRDDPAAFFRCLDGVFAIVILDKERDKLIWGRDPYGVRPMFVGWQTDGLILKMPEDAHDFSALTMRLLVGGATLRGLCIASEQKAIPKTVDHVIQFKPGCFGSVTVPCLDTFLMEQYHHSPWLKNPLYSPANPKGEEAAFAAVRFALEEAVRKRLMTERPVAALLSGGLDSSLIASLVQKNLRALKLPALKTFSIGMPGSTDLAYARKVADWIGSDHHEVLLDADDFFNAIPTVIKDTETYDITSVRASVGNWLVARAVREKTDCKVVFNGDGSDELFGSYLYFFNAPNDQAFEDEVGHLLDELYYYDVLRSDRSISSHGLEPRTPFLDRQFVAVCRSVATCWRRPVRGTRPEKWLLRKAFDDDVTLPSEVLWRQKEAFSDGVSSQEKSWFQEIQERVKVPVDWPLRALEIDHCTPVTAEAYYYRSLYEKLYGPTRARSAIPRFWMPKWCPGATDPSARTLANYSQKHQSH